MDNERQEEIETRNKKLFGGMAGAFLKSPLDNSSHIADQAAGLEMSEKDRFPSLSKSNYMQNEISVHKEPQLLSSNTNNFIQSHDTGYFQLPLSSNFLGPSPENEQLHMTKQFTPKAFYGYNVSANRARMLDGKSGSMFRKTRKRSEAPVLKLSSKLIETYVNINRLYYKSQNKRRNSSDPHSDNPSLSSASSATKRSKLFNNGYDDSEHNYLIVPGEIWNDKYRIIRLLGKGSFGQVVEAFDLQTKESVAVKIIKNRKAFYHQALIEIRILQFLNANDSDDSKNVVRLKSHFTFRNHLCLVYELLSFNLYDLLRNGNFEGVSLNLVRKFASQILVTLKYLDSAGIQIIHCDLKPENVILKKPNSHLIKVIDFGSSCFSDEKLYSYIQSRFYRSPEILLGHPYSTRIDMWSLGCMLVEMHTGQPLFNGSNEHDQLCRIQELLGPVPSKMLAKSLKEKVNRMFSQSNSTDTYSKGLNYTLIPAKNYSPRYNITLEDVIMKVPDISQRNEIFKQLDTYERHQYRIFIDLIQKMLQYDPEKRICPEEALKHEFFNLKRPRKKNPTKSKSRNPSNPQSRNDPLYILSSPDISKLNLKDSHEKHSSNSVHVGAASAATITGTGMKLRPRKSSFEEF